MLIVILTVAVVSAATAYDFFTRRIPNFITFPAIILGLSLNSYFLGFKGFSQAALGMIVGILLFLLPYMLGGMGAGDVKLLAAVGALNGVHVALYTFLYGVIAGGVIALGIAAKKRQLHPVLINSFSALHNVSSGRILQSENRSLLPITSGIKFPYGIAILCGVILTYLM